MATKKQSRNLKIYNEYQKGNTSYNKLAKKYDISPQRVQAIINKIKKQRVKTKLEPTDSQEKREEFKNLAVEVRENAKFKDALEMFNQVLKWDEVNKNYRGYVDVLGHIKITYSKLAETSKTSQEQEKYYSFANDTLSKAVNAIKKYDLGIERMAIMQVHKTSLLLKLAEVQNPTTRKQTLEIALKTINQAIKNLPGSEAHKAWPMAKKALILHKLEDTEKAIKVAHEAEYKLYLGYNDELDVKKKSSKYIIGNDQGVIKVKVWLSAIFVTLATIYKDEARFILAKYYANAVLSFEDKDGILKSIKLDAKNLLNEIKDIN